MTQSNIVLDRHNAALREENVNLRTALAETTLQLAQTLEELKICALPLFRQWRLRRLLKRRARALATLKEGMPASAEPSRIERPATPLIVVPR
jgi:hypothetical protein